MKTLHLVLKGKWYDKIASGEKTSEYRECKPYWNKRLGGHELLMLASDQGWTDVVFHRGYTNEIMQFKIAYIHALFNVPNDLNMLVVWEIKLGQRIK